MLISFFDSLTQCATFLSLFSSNLVWLDWFGLVMRGERACLLVSSLSCLRSGVWRKRAAGSATNPFRDRSRVRRLPSPRSAPSCTCTTKKPGLFTLPLPDTSCTRRSGGGGGGERLVKKKPEMGPLLFLKKFLIFIRITKLFKKNVN